MLNSQIDTEGNVFKGIMIEFGMCLVEKRGDLKLSREYSIPRMKVKGVLGEHVVRKMKAGIQIVEDEVKYCFSEDGEIIRVEMKHVVRLYIYNFDFCRNPLKNSGFMLKSLKSV